VSETPADVPNTEVGTFSSAQPYMRAGHGRATIVYLPGLMIQSGMPGAAELGSYESGYRPFLDVATFWTIWRPPHDRPTSMAEMAADYAAVIRSEIAPDGRAVGVIGLSTGGTIAQVLAIDHPDVVRRLVLSLTADRYSEENLAYSREVQGLVRRGKWRSVYARLARAMYPKSATRAAIALWTYGPRWIGAPKDPAHALAELEAEDAHDPGPRLGEIRAPTLVQGAELDPLCPPERSRALAAAIPGARHIEYPGVGHAGPGPKLLADAVAFLTAE
jgi:pimeloyl-ACP methyl ester carboxylesterase